MKNWLIRIASVLRLRARFRALRKTLCRVAFVVLALGVPWCAGALFHAFDMPVFFAWAGLIALLVSLVASLFSRWGLLAAALIEIMLTGVFCLISPEKRFDKTVWQTPWKQTLEVSKHPDGTYELRNVRDFLYRSETDYDVRYRTVTVDPEKISSIDAVFSHWDNQESIAHSMLGLNFADGETVVISLETRLPEDADQNGIDGIYRRYGLAMLAGTPNDFYGLRTDHRGETLYVYRLDMNHENLRNTTASILERAAELQVHPKFYNSLYRNCTTGLLPMLPGAVDLLSGDIRVILNGMAVQLLFEKDMIAHREGESFGSIRARSLVPGLCCGKDAPAGRYAGESEARWLRER
ncbi:MAG: DUF4105 domain-containing protein [Lentisphaeria bacterium]|nr:DUF4105 domain-containing protein [Lentisphaeria bacterium]